MIRFGFLLSQLDFGSGNLPLVRVTGVRTHTLACGSVADSPKTDYHAIKINAKKRREPLFLRENIDKIVKL